jgi:selenide,water dikinase
MGPEALAQVLRPLSTVFPAAAHPRLLIGLEGPDDAAVYKLNDELAVVQTVDFFSPIVDDPYTFGAVAAVNAMSDVWAMGGEVAFALNIAGFPDDLAGDVISEIFRGGAEMVLEAGGAIAGGHTIYDSEPKYGLCVTGLVHPDRIATKGGARPGDLLYLTKPLGSGLITTAAKRELPGAEGWLEGAIRVMLQFNRHPSHLAVTAGVRTMTDVTGFGLLGHADEIGRASGVAVQIDADRVPVLEGALESFELDVNTGGAGRNEAYVGPRVHFDPAIAAPLRAVLWDPQTAGGLLIAAGPEVAAALEAGFAADSVPLWRIGMVRAGSGIDVIRSGTSD